MSYAQEQVDVGQHMAELDESAAEIAWNRFEQENRQYLRELSARFPDCTMRPGHDDYAARMEESAKYVVWYKANVVPYPPARTRPYRPLAIVGRGGNRPGPMSDG